MTDYLRSFLTDDDYFDVFRRRARRELPEMDSCRDVVAIVAHVIREKFVAESAPSILDVGCATGYLYHSLRAVLRDFTYAGIDISERNIAEARVVFSGYENAEFHVADLYEFEGEKFDIVICANTLYSLPNASFALARLARLTRRCLIVRTPVGEVSLYCRISHDDVFNSEGVPDGHFYYCNIYTRSYLEAVLRRLECKTIEFFDPGPVSSHLAEHATTSFGAHRRGTTRIVEGRQVAGNLILDWQTIVAHF